VSILHDRITSQGYLAQPGYHPYGTADTPLVLPAAAVTYDGDTVLYGTLHPLVTADGATVPAMADVTYPATVPAGRP
jgi:hypothetical protein